MSSRFLTANWNNLVFLNYSCPTQLLQPLVPARTVLDLWQGEALVSMVGFQFNNTRLLGMRVPFHESFEEVNLRFYVRRTTPTGEARRAVVFVRELVPRTAIAWTARWLYNEPYTAVRMDHQCVMSNELGGSAAYSWWFRGLQFELAAAAEGASMPAWPGSESEFITEHYWGYTRQRDGGTLEYQVEHPSWRIWKASSSRFAGPAAALYGSAFGEILSQPPRSAFIAVGSDVVVHRGTRLARDSHR
jgi:uncharacterized protein YqjF (DUF2071 family)